MCLIHNSSVQRYTVAYFTKTCSSHTTYKVYNSDTLIYIKIILNKSILKKYSLLIAQYLKWNFDKWKCP